MGSIFDPLPSELTGNIHSAADPSEPVMGFITAATAEKQWLWIKHPEVNNWAYPLGSFAACDTIHLTTPARWALVRTGSYALIDALAPFSFEQFAAPVECADCTLQGGVNIKPPFWP